MNYLTFNCVCVKLIFMKYYKYKIENLIRVTKIITVHYFEFGKNFVSGTESHDFWEIVYADRGNVICKREGEEKVLSEGEIFFHKPNEEHSLRADSKNAPNVFIISFECKSEALHFFEGKTIKLNKSNVNFIYSIINEAKKTFNIPFSDPKVKKMPILEKPTLGGLQLIKNYLEILLINVLRDQTEIEGKNNLFLSVVNNGKISKRVIDILKDYAYKRIKIEDICKNMNYSKSYLFKKFKKETGRSIMDYYAEIKIECAKKLLREDNYSVTEIAEKLDFDSQSYFSKVFKKNTGYSPLKYKNMLSSNMKSD